MHMGRGGMHRGGRGDARASCASPLGTPLFNVICPFMWAESTFKKSLGGETLQLLTVFKVICHFICVASTFKNSLRGETL